MWYKDKISESDQYVAARRFIVRKRQILRHLFDFLKSNLFDFLRFEWSRDHVPVILLGGVWIVFRRRQRLENLKSLEDISIEKILSRGWKNRLYADWIVERYFYLTIEDFIDQVDRWMNLKSEWDIRSLKFKPLERTMCRKSESKRFDFLSVWSRVQSGVR